MKWHRGKSGRYFYGDDDGHRGYIDRFCKGRYSAAIPGYGVQEWPRLADAKKWVEGIVKAIGRVSPRAITTGKGK